MLLASVGQDQTQDLSLQKALSPSSANWYSLDPFQRLHQELPLSLEDLEDVFDALDADGNGFLTPEEFTTGFSKFWGGGCQAP